MGFKLTSEGWTSKYERRGDKVQVQQQKKRKLVLQPEEDEDRREEEEEDRREEEEAPRPGTSTAIVPRRDLTASEDSEEESEEEASRSEAPVPSPVRRIRSPRPSTSQPTRPIPLPLPAPRPTPPPHPSQPSTSSQPQRQSPTSSAHVPCCPFIVSQFQELQAYLENILASNFSAITTKLKQLENTLNFKYDLLKTQIESLQTVRPMPTSVPSTSQPLQSAQPSEPAVQPSTQHPTPLTASEPTFQLLPETPQDPTPVPSPAGIEVLPSPSRSDASVARTDQGQDVSSSFPLPTLLVLVTFQPFVPIPTEPSQPAPPSTSQPLSPAPSAPTSSELAPSAPTSSELAPSAHIILTYAEYNYHLQANSVAQLAWLEANLPNLLTSLDPILPYPEVAGPIHDNCIRLTDIPPYHVPTSFGFILPEPAPAGASQR